MKTSMERKIGEIFEYNGEWYQCVVAIQGCRECSFRTHDYCTRHLECLSDTRSDKTSVIFKKLEKVGEPYIEHDHSMNKDVVVQDYKLYNQHACYNGHEKILCFGLFGKDGIVTIKSKEPIKSLNCKNSVEIEIKQTKEDMEEKNNGNTPLNVLTDKYVKGDICYDDFEKEVKALYSCKEEIKPTLKEFDLEAAKLGKPVCTRDGRKARIICFDCKDQHYPIVALIECDDTEVVQNYSNKGEAIIGDEWDKDLMMLPEKKEGWAKVRKDINLYDTKEEADRKMIGNDEYVTAKVCWEE